MKLHIWLFRLKLHINTSSSWVVMVLQNISYISVFQRRELGSEVRVLGMHPEARTNKVYGGEDRKNVN